MKKMFYVAAALILAACSSPMDDEADTNASKKVTFTISEQLPMSRALADACTRLSYFRCTDGEVVSEIHQTSTDTDYGTIADNMEYGTHEVYFVGYNYDAEVGLTAGEDGYTYSFDKVGDTFSYYTSLTIDRTSSEQQTITMPRRVARFELVATDGIPANLSTMDIRLEGASVTLDAKTGKGAAETVQTKTITIPASVLGTTNNTFVAYAFLLEETGTLTVTLTAKDASGNTIQSHTLTGVEMETNYITRYTGNFFSNGIGSQVSASTDWADIKENEF